MFDNYTSAGKLYKKVVAVFVVITVIATAIFYSYLTKQNANKSKAALGEFASISFDPPTTTVEVGREYTTTVKFEASSHPIAVQGYNIGLGFDINHLKITHITYKLGQVSQDLGDSDATLSGVNTAGTINLTGEVASQNAQVLNSGAEIATITYTVIDKGLGGGLPNFQSTVNAGGEFVELRSDSSLASLAINQNSFTVQTSNFTPVPNPAACGRFQDVDPNSPFYSYIQCLGCNQITTGYACGAPPAGQCTPPDNLPYFMPVSDMTRGQMMKVVALAAHYADQIPPTQQTFQDVTPGSTFWTYVEQAYGRHLISGYVCGGDNPCVAPENRPYFKPNDPITRGQGVKVVTIAAGYTETIPSGTQTFHDVAPGSTFYDYVERAFAHGLISGYNCVKDTNEPCDAQNRPYFRPNSSLNRSQAAKVVAIGLNCQLPGSGSPTPAPVGNTTLNMKLYFQGITTKPLVDQKMKVQVKVLSASVGQVASESVEFTSDAQGLWTGSTSFNLNSNVNPPGTRFSLYIKGPKHLKKRVCDVTPKESAPGIYACASDAIPLQSGTNTIDMSGIYQLVGDLPVDQGQQNGVVDAEDTTYLRLHFGDTSAEALAIGDLNLDGVVDTQDFSLVLAALGVKYDDPEETLANPQK